MLTLIALLLALLVLPSPWSAIVVVCAAVVDVIETGTFVWWSRRRRRKTTQSVGAETIVGGAAWRSPGSGRPGPAPGDRCGSKVRSGAPARPSRSRPAPRSPSSASKGSPGRRSRAQGATEPVTTLRLTIEYDGSGFHGWARQPGQRTVEGALGEALDAIYPSLARARRGGPHRHRCSRDRPGRERRPSSGGRACGARREALNTALPADLSVLAVAEAPDGFHARFSAVARSYRYVISAGATRSPSRRAARCGVRGPLALETLERAAAILPGEHDFRRSPRRRRSTRSSAARSAPPHGTARRSPALHGDGRLFLRHMVRTLVGTMLESTPAELA